jgi:hypothetical protein
MQLMELTPSWRLRGAGLAQGNAALSSSDAPEAGGVMIMALAASQSGQRLWASMARVLAGLGYDSVAIQEALILQAPVADHMRAALMSRRPATLMIFGDDLGQAVQRSMADAIGGAIAIHLPSLESMVSTPEAARLKRQAWALMAAHRNTTQA